MVNEFFYNTITTLSHNNISIKNTLFFLKENLNYEQFMTVKNINGIFLVLAGAGSGKTRVLVYRSYFLIKLGIPAEKILIVTFTKKACYELKNRINNLLGNCDISIETFHSLAYKILKKYSSNKNFRIFLPDELDIFFKSEFSNLSSISLKIPENIAFLFTLFCYSKKELEKKLIIYTKKEQNFILNIFNRLSIFKSNNNLYTFDDLIFKAYALLKSQNNFEFPYYIMVDEFQDTDLIQFKFLKILSKYKNLFVVGDDFQSIYSFKGAIVDNIINFKYLFNNVKTFTLLTNYRSSPEIVDFTNEIQKIFKIYIPKKMNTPNISLKKPSLNIFTTHHEEIKFIFNIILKLYKKNSIVLLFRNYIFMYEFIEYFKLHNLPYSLEIDDKKNIILTTVHSSKGLEWDCVFIPCLLEGVFPSSIGSEIDLEEEKRLFYVACSRAKKYLFLSFSLTLYTPLGFFSEPSSFLSKLDKHFFQIKRHIKK